MEKNKESILIGYPNVIPYESHNKIKEQMEKDICKITISNIQGTGFFCKIPFPDQSNMLPVFITNNHIINKDILYENSEKIKIDIKEELEIKEIKLNNRMKYTNEEYDITIIEIKEEDNIKNYLKLDDNIINDVINNINKNRDYINETIYIIQFPENKLSVSYGILEQIFEDNKHNYIHKCNTKRGSSGSPILTLNNRVIGIHKEGFDNRFNIGTLLNYPIKKFIQIYYKSNIKKMKMYSNYDISNKDKITNNDIINITLTKNKLIDNIKSNDIINIVFSNLDEKIKLKSIKYNKKLQNIINIKLINYKFLSGKYIIYGENGIGKIYSGDSDNLLFEG